jgi:hypothetical protein
MWLELTTDDFVDALKRLKPKRGGSVTISKLETQISLIDGEAVIVVNGALTKCPGVGDWRGFVCLSFGFLLPFTKIKPKTETLRLEYTAGKLKVETAKITAVWVETSPWVTSQLAEAHLNNLLPEKISYRFCPACGKRKGMDLKDITNRTRPTQSEKTLIEIYKTTKSTHGCIACGHGWIEIALVSSN